MNPASAQITRKAKSNLAFALLLLPREKRRDTEVFYAYCRTIDDIADEPGTAIEQRVSQLDGWQDVLMQRRLPSEPLQEEILTLLAKHQLDPELLCALIEGCRSDLAPRHFPTWHDLSQYIWQAATLAANTLDHTGSTRTHAGATASERDAWALRLGPTGSTAIWLGFDKPTKITHEARLAALLNECLRRLGNTW